MMLSFDFFDKDACELAKALLGKVLRVKYHNIWLSAQIIETEAYYLHEKGSHASLGFTQKRKALFMSPGTIYMYYAHGGDSLNISAQGEGNAVLIKSGIPYLPSNVLAETSNEMVAVMQQLNPVKNGMSRKIEKLCSGQTLLCKSLNLKVREWDQKQFDVDQFYIEDVGYIPVNIIQTTRLGIPAGRDEHLPYRYVDQAYVRFCTRNPLTKQRLKKNE